MSAKMSPTMFFTHFSKLNKAEAEEIEPEFSFENADNLFNDNFTPSEVSKLLLSPTPADVFLFLE